MILRVVCLLSLVGWLGCSGSKHTAAMTGVSTDTDGGAAASRECMDTDGDGFGKYCTAGEDCDDTDPMVTDECVRCAAPNLGCPCEPGTVPMRCNPHYVKKTTQDGQTGTLVCSEGTRYCRDSAYSDCEILFMYATFIPDK